MKNTIIKYTTIIIIAFIAGNLTAWKFLQHETIKIVEGPIHYKPIDRDVSKMETVDKDKDLQHFYKDKPTIDIKHVSGDNYVLTGSLYIRSWDKNVTIEQESKSKNMLIASALVDSKLNPGIMLQYYRMYGPIGFGGGLGGTANCLLLNAGVLYSW